MHELKTNEKFLSVTSSVYSISLSCLSTCKHCNIMKEGIPLEINLSHEEMPKKESCWLNHPCSIVVKLPSHMLPYNGRPSPSNAASMTQPRPPPPPSTWVQGYMQYSAIHTVAGLTYGWPHKTSHIQREVGLAMYIVYSKTLVSGEWGAVASGVQSLSRWTWPSAHQWRDLVSWCQGYHWPRPSGRPGGRMSIKIATGKL